MAYHNKQQKLNNSTMADKLGKAFGSRGPRPTTPILKRLIDLVGDGEDHINTYLDCKTELGTSLSPFTVIPFTHPLFGKFDCRQGLYYYLLSEIGDEAFRTYTPKRMRAYATETGNMGKFYPNLRYHLAVAQWLQIKNNDTLKQQIIDNQLPYDAYFIRKIRSDNSVSHIPSRPNTNASWIVAIVNIISSALKKGEEPNFDSLIDNKNELEKLRNRITRPVQTPPPPKKPKQKPVLAAAANDDVAKVDSQVAVVSVEDLEPAEGVPVHEDEVTDGAPSSETVVAHGLPSGEVVQEPPVEPVVQQAVESAQEQSQVAPVGNSYYD